MPTDSVKKDKKAKLLEPPGWWFLILGVIYPAFTIGFELVTQMCAESLFDPMPTIIHKLLVVLVPVSNFLVWRKLRGDVGITLVNLDRLICVAIGIATYYALVFMPLYPMSIIGVLWFGIGLLPLAPLVSLVCAVRLRNRLKAQNPDYPTHRFLIKGIALSLLVLVLIDIPSAATHLGINLAVNKEKDNQERGVWLLRSFGSQDLLLRSCYTRGRRATGPLSLAVIVLTQNWATNIDKNREVFYRVTGEPFNRFPVPHKGQQWSQFDPDQGGEEVGSKIKNLELVSSRIDGVISADDGVAYLEWVMMFENNSQRQREARLQMALPPDGVVSRVTLWINGEEKEAAFAGRGKVRAAYEKVVRTRRDPLLVTTAGPDRVLAQAFPIEPDGGQMKIRIGITAPLHLLTQRNASLVLPAIVDKNFNIGDSVKHAVWIEGQRPLTTSLAGTNSKQIKPELYRIDQQISDQLLSDARIVLKTPWVPSVAGYVAQLKDNEVVLQGVENVKPVAPDALMLVVDGSKNLDPHIDGIIETLDAVPTGVNVGLFLAALPNRSVGIKPWSESHKREIIDALLDHNFVGGQDNVPALVDAMRALEQYQNSELLWLHAPQPVIFDGSKSVLAQASSRLTQLPKLTLYNVVFGPNRLLDKTPKWSYGSQRIAKTGSVEIDVGGYLKARFATQSQPRFVRVLVDGKSQSQAGSKHIARLWAKDKVNELLAGGNIPDAIDLAASYQLVTPVSGAVVLESEQQYKDADLKPVDKNTVPTIPEPHQWILALIMMAFILWFLKHNKAALMRQV